MKERPRKPSDGRAWAALLLVTDGLRFLPAVNQLALPMVNEELRSAHKSTDQSEIDDPANIRFRSHTSDMLRGDGRYTKRAAFREADVTSAKYVTHSLRLLSLYGAGRQARGCHATTLSGCP